MSQENVERVQRLYTHLNEGEIDAVLAMLDPDVQWWTRSDNPDIAVVRGREGWRALWTQITGVLEEFRTEPTEIIDAGEYVVACVHQFARTRDVVIEQDEVHVARVRDGYVIEIREFHEKDEALKAVGLAELMRLWVEAASRRDLDAMMELYAPDAVMDYSTRGLGVFEGAAAIRTFLEDYFASFEELTFEQLSGEDMGHGVVFGVLAQEGRPVGSDSRIRMQEGAVAVWVGGLMVRGSSYEDIDQARAAAERLAQERADG